MSQYPWIYQPPTAPRGYDPASQLLAPARRAGTLAIILGSLLLLCGGATLFVGLGFDNLPDEIRSQMRADLARYGVAGVTPQALYTGAAVVVLIVGVVLVVLGILSLRGGMGSIVSLMVLVALLLIFFAIQIVGGLVATKGDPRMLAGLCGMAIPVALLGLLMWFLVAAVREAPRVWAMRMQHQAAFWQHQQHQQQYQQGLGAPPPPPPPASEQHQTD
jgi:hypothetical protein